MYTDPLFVYYGKYVDYFQFKIDETICSWFKTIISSSKCVTDTQYIIKNDKNPNIVWIRG